MTSKNDKKQALPESYFREYDSLKRFISYFYQIDSVSKTNSRTVLEVGIGNRTVTDYLKKMGFEVKTCDINKNLNPDIIADIKDLPLEENSFDTILACQVLEHIPFSDLEKALSELKRVARRNVIISIPYTHYYLEGMFKIVFPFFERQFRLSIKLPFLKKKIENREEHYWEMGTSGYSKKMIKNLIKKYFKISEEFKPILNSNRYFFILEKR